MSSDLPHSFIFGCCPSIPAPATVSGIFQPLDEVLEAAQSRVRAQEAQMAQDCHWPLVSRGPRPSSWQAEEMLLLSSAAHCCMHGPPACLLSLGYMPPPRLSHPLCLLAQGPPCSGGAQKARTSIKDETERHPVTCLESHSYRIGGQERFELLCGSGGASLVTHLVKNLPAMRETWV